MELVRSHVLVCGGTGCTSSGSAQIIDEFEQQLKNFNIDMDICTTDTSDFKSFNDFFIRKLTNEARPISKDNNLLISPGDGRLLAYTDINIDSLIQVKGISYSLSELLEDNSINFKLLVKFIDTFRTQEINKLKSAIQDA